MASYESPRDDAANDDASKPRKIEFRFCKECANMLYPREDRTLGTLSFQCRNCQFAEEVGPVCIYRNELSNTVGETSGVTQDVASDPTVGDIDSASVRPVFNHAAPSANPDTDSKVSLSTTVPAFCTFCGNEITCPICDEPTDGGEYLEVSPDEEQYNDAPVDSTLEEEVDRELRAEDR